MCGILGYFNHKKTSLTREAFESALHKMIHRGPDGWGVFEDANIMFGHRRLSIIDLSTSANQPFQSLDGKVVICFNGEIYNYKEISHNLTLRTSSDTEVLLEGYLKEGIDFFKKIRGIYAFAIYDNRGNEPFCIMLRDQAGVKPFYFIHNQDGFVFASEIKSILPLLKQKPAINLPILKKYIHLGYCPEPETAYQNIFALDPGTCYTYSIVSGELKKEVLFHYDFSDLPMTEKQAEDETEKLLKIACKRNMVADVKVNIALSGGIDSSLVYAYSNLDETNKVNGITIKFDEKEYDESEVAKAYSDHLKAPGQVVTTEVTNRFELLNTLLLHFDQPYADSSFIPFYFLCEAAAKHSKVLIGGDSGDEIHNGYAGHKTLPYLESVRNSLLKFPAAMGLSVLSTIFKGEKKRFTRKLSGMAKVKDLSNLLFYWESWFPPDEAMYPFNPFKYDLNEVKKPSKSGTAYDQIEESYFNGRMISDYLRKSDMMSMFNSLEFRVPMLDEDLTAFSLRIPYNYKSDRKTTKKILRKLHRDIYPEEFSKLKKKGFTIPLDTWLGDENLNIMRSYLLRSDAFASNFIKHEYIEYLFNAVGNNQFEDYISRPSAYQRILVLYSMELWHENYLKS
jgi:asparagine synthase (glutamine-hydrolysing)